MISVVVPIYNEEEIIPRLHHEIRQAMRQVGQPWEVVYVNDGSRDRTLELLHECQQGDPHVVIVELSRNWGHQPALSAGLSIAQGDAVVWIDGDLQDPPTLIPELVQAWKNGAEVVVAQRRSRPEKGLRGWCFRVFYRVLGLLSDFPIPLNAGIFGLLDRKAVDAINDLRESNRYLPGLRSWVGYRSAVVFYDRADRAAGEPKQSFIKLLKYGLDAIFSFSYKPLRFSLFAGAGLACLSFLSGLVLILCRLANIGLFGQPVVAGYTSIIVAVLFFSGIQLFSIGVLGEYIGRIYDEVKQRPLYIIRHVYKAPLNSYTLQDAA
ncbi:MAG: glycosyltransferase family 2 protein [Gemmataceae bacterium]